MRLLFFAQRLCRIDLCNSHGWDGGETAFALEWLETALAEREPFLGSLIVFPGDDAIRDQARFIA